MFTVNRERERDIGRGGQVVPEMGFRWFNIYSSNRTISCKHLAKLSLSPPQSFALSLLVFYPHPTPLLFRLVPFPHFKLWRNLFSSPCCLFLFRTSSFTRIDSLFLSPLQALNPSITAISVYMPSIKDIRHWISSEQTSIYPPMHLSSQAKDSNGADLWVVYIVSRFDLECVLAFY